MKVVCDFYGLVLHGSLNHQVKSDNSEENP